MKKQGVLLLLILFGIVPIFASSSSSSSSSAKVGAEDQKKEVKKIQEQKKEKEEVGVSFATHGLFIYLDDSETALNYGVSRDLYCALIQKVPCLASTSLLKAIFINTPSLSQLTVQLKDPRCQELDDYYHALLNRLRILIGGKKIVGLVEQQQIVDQINKDFPRPPIDYMVEGNKARYSLLRQHFPLDQNEWIIKFVDRAKRLCLLIPKKYRNTLNNFDLTTYKPLVEPLTVNGALTQTEYKIGLKVDHMYTVQDFYKELTALDLPVMESADYFVNALWNKKRESVTKVNSSDIFVSRAEYAQVGDKQMPRWSFYMSGHGSLDDMQVSLLLPSFNTTLDFFGRRIDTSLLVYETCYAVDTDSAKLVYQDMERQGVARTYPYVIVTQGIAYAISVGFLNLQLSNFTRNNIDFNRETIRADSKYDYGKFLSNVTTSENIDFAKALAPIMEIDFSYKGKVILTVPRIRLAGKERFNLVDTTHKVAFLGSIFAKTCTTIDLEAYFIKNKIKPSFYFLDTPFFPCDFVFSFKGSMPLFVPTASGKLPQGKETFTYYIRKIFAPTMTLPEIIRLFTKSIPELYQFTLWIGEINAKNCGALLAVKKNIKISDVSIMYYHDVVEEIDDLSVGFVHKGKAYFSNSLDKPAVETTMEYLRDRKKEFDADFAKLGEFKQEAEAMRKLFDPKLKEAAKKKFDAQQKKAEKEKAAVK